MHNRFSPKLACFLFLSLFCTQAWSGDTLRQQLDELLIDEAFKARALALGNEATDTRAEIDKLLASARSDLEIARENLAEEDEDRKRLADHVAALSALADKFARIENLENYDAIAIEQFDVQVDDCQIAIKIYINFAKFNCTKEYEFAINIWRRTLLAGKILNTWMGKPRAYNVNQIAESKQRWEQFSEKVSGDQFIWETLVNGWLIEGSISTPPRNQFRLFHPIALLSYAEDSGDYEEEIGLEVFGLRTYGEQYDPEWGFSLFALLDSGNARETGLGISLSHKNFTFAVVVQDTIEADDETKILLGYNLAKLFENKKNQLADKKKEYLDKLEKLKPVVKQ